MTNGGRGVKEESARAGTNHETAHLLSYSLSQLENPNPTEQNQSNRNNIEREIGSERADRLTPRRPSGKQTLRFRRHFLSRASRHEFPGEKNEKLFVQQASFRLTFKVKNKIVEMIN